MCIEIRHISCSNLLRMSSSSNIPPNPPVVEEEEEEAEAGANKEEAVEFHETASSETAEKTADDPENEKLQKGKGIISYDDDDRKDHATGSKIVSSLSELPQDQWVSEDDEGFKTPTSPDHKIPAVTQCPPAPMKPRLPSISLKRKASPPPSGVRRSLQFGDPTTEVESIFRPVVSDQKDNVEEQESKRARNKDCEEDSD